MSAGLTVSMVESEVDALRSLYAMLDPAEFWNPYTLASVEGGAVEAFVEQEFAKTPAQRELFTAMRGLRDVPAFQRITAAAEVLGRRFRIRVHRAAAYIAGLPAELTISEFSSLYGEDLGVRPDNYQVKNPITWLPENLEVPGRLRVSECKALMRIPAGLKVGEGFTLEDNDRVEVIPDDLEVGEFLTLSDCRALRMLPPAVRVGLGIELAGLPNLTELPDQMTVVRLDISNCDGLRALPRGLQVERTLDVVRCEQFERMPENLFIPEDLILESCPRFKSFPKGLHIGRDLNLIKMPAELMTPERLEGVQVGRHLKQT